MARTRTCLGTLMPRTALTPARITVTDQGRPAAVLMNPQEPAELEDALALAEYRFRQASGEAAGIPHAEVRRRLGLERG